MLNVCSFSFHTQACLSSLCVVSLWEVHPNAPGMEIPLPWNNIPQILRKKNLERKMTSMWDTVMGS